MGTSSMQKLSDVFKPEIWEKSKTNTMFLQRYIDKVVGIKSDVISRIRGRLLTKVNDNVDDFRQKNTKNAHSCTHAPF